MKLAEALSLRKDVQKRIDQIKERLCKNVKVQEGEQPLEAPDTLFKELDACLKQLADLVYRINQTNMMTMVDDKPLTYHMAQREVLAKRLAVLREIFNDASSLGDRYSRTEIKQVTTIDVAKLSKNIDALSKQYRELDYKIQAVNFQTDLV